MLPLQIIAAHSVTDARWNLSQATTEMFMGKRSAMFLFHTTIGTMFIDLRNFHTDVNKRFIFFRIYILYS